MRGQPVQRFQTITARPASPYGRGRSRTALTTLKIVLLAPMPNATVSTMAAAKPGWARMPRKA